ncbi:hypothetical protein [Xanthomonas citri]|uniref:hypothetical protein n=1 Tax=Xanthomonas citri TaxID=346 RepID=UPI0013E01046|nr:hypothetical protein [Xanthomonas citri]
MIKKKCSRFIRASLVVANFFIVAGAGAVPFSQSFSEQYSGIPLSNAINIAAGQARVKAYHNGDGWGQSALSSKTCPMTSYTWWQDPVLGLTVIATVTCTREI